MNTAIKKTIYTVNNTEFDSDYIGFETHQRWSNCTEKRISAETFVYVWQKSNNLKDFRVNIEALFYLLYPKESKFDYRLVGIWESSLRPRAKRYRAKGVKLKEYTTPRTRRWNNLASFAQTI